MSEAPLKAEFFVTRNTGIMVSLVAVDELPHHITIAGVSRVMSVFDIAGMTCVGHSNKRNQQYHVRDAPELAASNTTPSVDPLKSKYFITRDSGIMVPLVAMDEMPPEFVIDGVPRILSVFDVIGMTCVGVADARDRSHIVEDVKNAPLSYFIEKIKPEYPISIESEGTYNTPQLGPVSPVFEQLPEPVVGTNLMNAAVKKAAVNTPSPVELPAVHVNKTQPKVNGTVKSRENMLPYKQHSSTQSSSVNSPTIVSTSPRSLQLNFNNKPGKVDTPTIANGPGTGTNKPATDNNRKPDTEPETPNTGVTPATTTAPGTKEYCSYWIRHGECDYQQQGCLYKHQMPLDQDSLLRLGLRDIPRWYREKYALGSYLAAGGSGAAFSGDGMKSATASGTHEDDKKNNMARNWRKTAGANPNLPTRPPSPQGGRRGNVYNPRSNRIVMNPSSFSRVPNIKPPFVLPNGKVRGNKPSVKPREHEFHDQHGMIDILRAKYPARSKDAAINISDADVSSPIPRPRKLMHRESTSTVYSDIEATVYRGDVVRRAKEDAEYKKVCDAYAAAEKKVAEEEAARKAVGPKTVTAIRGRRSSSGNRGARHAPHRRGRRTSRTLAGGEQVAEKTTALLEQLRLD